MTAFAGHRQQQGQAGCLYLSTYAILGEEGLLAHVEDTSDVRFAARLAELGVLAFPFWITPAGQLRTPPDFWQALRDRFTHDNSTEQRHAPLLVSIPGTTLQWLHQVALLLPAHPDEDEVHVSDSSFPEPLSLRWAVFLESDYAQAHRVEMLGPLDLDAYAEGGTP